MIYNLGLLAAIALAGGYVALEDTKALNRGYKKTDFFYVKHFFITIFTLPLILIFGFEFELTLISALLLISLVFIRKINVRSSTNISKAVSPLEDASYAILPLAITYIIDTFLGITTFSIIAIVGILVIILGNYMISKNYITGKILKESLIRRAITTIIMAYVGYYLLQYTNVVTYMFLVYGITTLFTTITYRKKIEKIPRSNWITASRMQVAGTIVLFASTVLMQQSVTMYMLKLPINLITIIVLTASAKKGIGKIPTTYQFMGAFVCVAGILAYAISQI